MPRIRPRLLAGIAGAALAALVLAGCGSSASTAEVSSGAAGEPVEGGTLTFADIELQTDFQVQKGFNYTQSNVFRNVFDRLTAFDAESGELVPWIATSWSANDDATQYVFEIRDGVTFSDGTPLDAAAVKANLDQLGLGDESKAIVKNRDFIGYESSEVTGDDEVTVTLSEPNADFVKATAASTASLVAPATLALDYEGQADISQVIGSGPFVFESQIADQEIRFTKRDDYAWAPSNSTNQGAAHLDEIVFRAIPEVGLRVGAVTSGQVDVARGIQPTDEVAAAAAGVDLVIADAPELTANWLAFRADTAAVVDDPAVREALKIGFDREGLKSTVLSDSYPLSGSVLNRAAPGFVDLSDEFAYDLDRAEKLLDDAGWKTGSDGVREKDGQRLELSVAASPRSVVIKPAFEYIQAEWAKLGVDLTSNAGDSAILATALGDPTYSSVASRQFYLGGLGPLFISGNTNTYITDPDLDDLFAAERATTDDAERGQLLADIQEYLVNGTNLVIPLWDEVQVHAVGDGVHITFDGGTAPLLQEAWVS